MIRTAEGGLTTRFFNAAFLDFMSHHCDVEAIPPCAKEGDVYEVNEELMKSVPEAFVKKIMKGEMHAFTKVGRLPFVRKKFVQLIAIAKSDEEIQLDLVSELILWLIGTIAFRLRWKDENGHWNGPNKRISFPERDVLRKEFMRNHLWVSKTDPDYEEILKETEASFENTYCSFVSLMRADSKETIGIFWDIDFTFLHDVDVPSGICTLYTVCSDYDRTWHERPWVEIGEPVPIAVSFALDQVEAKASRFGGIEAMRSFAVLKYQEEVINPIVSGRPEILDALHK